MQNMKNTRHPFAVNRLPALVAGTIIAASVALCCSRAQAQSSISGLYPNGTNMFQPSSTLSFTASSPAGITNVTVQLTVLNLYSGQSFIKSLTAANGLTISGPSTAENVSAVLASNTLYTAVIHIQDANGVVANQTVTFDTIIPVYTWEAEDWDYTSNGVSGLFIDNPQTNAYAGLLTTDNVDAHNANGPSPYRIGGDAGGGGMATETISSPESNYRRLQYIGTGKSDYDVGYTDGSDFGVYTRTYPSGTYNLFVRAAGGGGAKTESADITVTAGSAVITSPASGPYKFGVKGNGWQNFDFMPVTDSAGNLVQITFNGGANSLKVLQNQASDNMNFFMLMPVAPVVLSTVTITNVYPNGAFQFQQTNKLSFEAISSVSINPASDVTVNLAGTNLFGVGSVANLTTANGLTVTGSATDIIVTTPLASNMVYTAFIQVSDANGVPASSTVIFDTISPAYAFEGEDFNYGGGFFVDNPQTNGYSGLDGTAEVDYHRNNSGGNGGYNRIGLPGEGANDVARVTHVGFPDYDLGNTAGGNWGNYTRTYPSGIYNIFVRTARGDGGNVTDAGKVSLVTGDITQPNQTVQDLGKHNTPSTSGWQKYVWAPIMNSGGFPARFVADGSVKTLRYTFDSAGENVGFIMLLPADLSVNPPPFITGFTPDGTALFQPSNTVTFVVNSSVGIAQTNVVVSLNGVKASGLTFSGSSTLWNVTCPVQTNKLYTAIVTLTDTAGTTSVTNTFATFDGNNYQWEAEDYNHDNGQFTDNPQLDAYNGLGSVSNVDNVQTDFNGGRPLTYRLDGSPGAAPGTGTGDAGGELPRANFTSGGGSGTDYSVGYFGNGAWLNYTRHYPAGTYNVVGRFAEGNNPTEDTLSLVAGDVTTVNQTTTMLGTFPIVKSGWSSWTWSALVDGSGNPVKVTLDGSAKTFRLGGTPIAGHDEANVGFLMLVKVAPSPKLTASGSGGGINVSFPTENGYTYQLQYKNNLSDPVWTSVGVPVTGDGTVKSAGDSSTSSSRFYLVKVQ